MTDDEGFLARWSRRKIASRTTEAPQAEAKPPAAASESPAPAAGEVSPARAEALPPIESLTPESDFTPFLKADVDPELKRGALRKLFEDPRYNVMDGLDVYIDDYSKPDPLPEGWLERLNQVRRLGDFVEAPNDPDEPPKAPQLAPPEAGEGRLEGVPASNTDVPQPSQSPMPESSEKGGQ